MNAICEIYTAKNADVDLNKILDVNAFDLDKKVEFNPKFGEEEFPFEAISNYKLGKGKYQLVLEKGPDPSIDLFITPYKDLNKQKHEVTVAFAGQSTKTDNKGTLKLHELLCLNTTSNEQSFDLEVDAGEYLFFTEHGPDEFNMALRHDGAIVKPNEVIEIAHSHSHDEEISSVGIKFNQPLDFKKFQSWLSHLLDNYGQDIFRSKGILYFSDTDKRVVFQGVHMLFDAIPDREWKKGELKRNQLVFIGKNLDRKMLNDGVENCLA